MKNPGPYYEKIRRLKDVLKLVASVEIQEILSEII